MKGTSEERTERGMDGARERGEGESEWRRDWARKGGGMGAREGGKLKGRWYIHKPTIHKPALETLVLQMTNSEHV